MWNRQSKKTSKLPKGKTKLPPPLVGTIITTIGLIIVAIIQKSSNPFFIPAATETPITEPVSFQDFEENNGTPPGPGNYFWGAAYMLCNWEPHPTDPKSPVIVFEGERAARCEVETKEQISTKDIQGGTVGINPAREINDPVDLSRATVISVWIYDTTQGGNNAEIKLRDSKNIISNGIYSSSKTLTTKNAWTQLTWTLSGFQKVDLRHIKNLEIYVYNDGVYYFDNVTYK